MKKLVEILYSINYISILALFIFIKKHYIKPSFLNVASLNLMTLQAILALYEYKETKNKIHLIIPILHPFFLLSLIVIKLRS